MRGTSQAVLARWAKDALREYERVSEGGVTQQALIPLLMASLGHLANQMGPGGEKAFADALELYRYEKESHI